MESHVNTAITELGLSDAISSNFPTAEQMNFIQSVMCKNDVDQALQGCSTETVQDFEKDGLAGKVSAPEFFKKLGYICQRGSYKSVDIRMDFQVSTRACHDAPDCNFHVVLNTTDWTKQFNMKPSTAENLLEKLLEARSTIRRSKEASHSKTD
uniref:COMM domain-containing protein n=1 Tax=Caenorhabditis japonica TaxID=281687 RepID=A0A8R1EEG0_CAEJA